MPLVIWDMGTSSTGRCGQTCDHIRRATEPCKRLTPLQWDARCNPRINIDKGALAGEPAVCPQDNISVADVPNFSSSGFK